MGRATRIRYHFISRKGVKHIKAWGVRPCKAAQSELDKVREALQGKEDERLVQQQQSSKKRALEHATSSIAVAAAIPPKFVPPPQIQFANNLRARFKRFGNFKLISYSIYIYHVIS